METDFEQNINKLRDFIYGSSHAVFFGGAGVSTESGIPDFRSKNGLYNQHDVRFDGYSPEYLLSRDCITGEPEVFFEFCRQKLDTRKVAPNPAHLTLARLESEGRLSSVITQNIDSLHQRAGSKKVIELHGSTERNYCCRCGKKYGSDALFESASPVPRCSCGGIIRPDVTLYGEQLPQQAVRDALNEISSADFLIIGGTSLSVYPAASFIRYFRGRHLAVINRDRLDVRAGDGDIQINAPIGDVLSKI